ncbi:LysR substrate-binding domain-containing protein [Fulvivirga kasyanovii]|uniref:LysR family transcriptional regulator n=1 Tax=Fulvivirga kasyanovii TaxID=396812 RepID=A0ABW9RVT4_9BACT|nr:LysR family transcriptional regulator [Fulvivirga kasyanovii]MTI28334.1 LysR family transcriptional regulator [Fulvivirga kasyanovii]
MELKHFRLIKTIAEEGNIANSSEKLFLTQSALSHQLRELEEQLGFKVFHRSRNKWELTDEGAELHKLANTIHAAIEQGFHSIKKINEGTKGLVRISTECYSFYQGLPTFIQKMAALYPKIEVELILDATHQPVSKILSNDLDMAIVTSRPASPALSSKALFEDEIFAIMHREHPLADKPHVEAGDFTEAHLIIHSFPLETVSVYQTFLKPNHIIPVRISAIPLTEVALEMVSANMGITCMPQWALTMFRIPEELVFKRIGKNGLKRTHYLISRVEDQSKKYISEFISSFEEDFVG